jgi:signal transduction histidine kinase
MSSQVTGILTVLENLLAWSKLKLFETDLIPVPVFVNIKELFTEQTDFFIPNAVNKHIQIRNEVPDDLIVRCDEYILGTIFRNAIANAMNNSVPAELVILSADKTGADLVCSIKNKCSQVSFENFQSSFTNATVQSGSHGLGLVLIKEFARIINAVVTLSYTGNWAKMNISLRHI